MYLFNTSAIVTSFDSSLSSDMIAGSTDEISNNSKSSFRLNKHLENIRQNINVTSNEIKEFLQTVELYLSVTDSEKSRNAKKSLQDKSGQSNLLTLFTTWPKSDDPTGRKIHNNTLINWASLQPAVKPVLFTDDDVLIKDAHRLGWSVQNLTQTANNGLPILKYLYMQTMSSVNSLFYAFVNSDILFDESLLTTLVNIQFSFGSDVVYSKPLLVTGKRFNLINIAENEFIPKRHLYRSVKKKGQLFSISAEDYFITNAIYPWSDIPDVVVGSIAYDNWIVMNARARNFITIDASKTLLAVHQSIDSNNHRSHMRDTAGYNKKLLGDLFKGNVPYNRGFVDCIERYTDIVNDTFVVLERVVDKTCY